MFYSKNATNCGNTLINPKMWVIESRRSGDFSDLGFASDPAGAARARRPFWLVTEFVAVVAPAPLRGSDMGPAGGAVDGAGVARRLDEGLDEHGGGAIALGPVLRQAAADDGENVRAKVEDTDPGQDQEPGVVDDQRQALLALLRRLSDEGVTRGELPCRRAEAEHGERPAVAVVDRVAHLGADQGLVAEIVLTGDKLVPQLALAGAAHDGAQVEGANVIEGGRRREQRRVGGGEAAISACSSAISR